MTTDAAENLHEELMDLINKYSIDAQAGVPDYIIANFLLNSLDSFISATDERDEFFASLDEKEDMPTETEADVKRSDSETSEDLS